MFKNLVSINRRQFRSSIKVVRYSKMSSGKLSTNTEDLWKNLDVKIIYRAAHKATSVFARALVKQSGVIDAAARSLTSSANDKGLVIMYQACGTGAVAEALYDTFESTHGQQGARPDCHLKCTDLSPPMLEAMEELAKSRNWANMDVAKSDILNNGLAAQSFDYVFASFILMGLPDSVKALNESLQILKPGGTIAMNTWASLAWIEEFNTASTSVSQELPQITYTSFSRAMGDGKWEDESWIMALLESKQLKNIQLNIVKESIPSGKPSEWAQICTFPIRLVMQKIWTEEQRKEYSDKLFHAFLEQSIGKAGSRDMEIARPYEAIVITAQKSI